MRIPPPSVPSHVGATDTVVKCEATSCTSTGVLAFLAGGALGAFFAFQAGSMFGGYQVHKKSKR